MPIGEILIMHCGLGYPIKIKSLQRGDDRHATPKIIVKNGVFCADFAITT